ncbi:MAG TPA: hypothetical protein DE276_06060, partial [Oceanospirillaceae bacterium]|nr:hypothetical protein [Oceanospirillaceae bacterium]
MLFKRQLLKCPLRSIKLLRPIKLLMPIKLWSPNRQRLTLIPSSKLLLKINKPLLRWLRLLNKHRKNLRLSQKLLLWLNLNLNLNLNKKLNLNLN